MFKQGLFYTYSGVKKKSFYIVECLYADDNVAVLRPFDETLQKPMATFSAPQNVKFYTLCENFNVDKHRVKYYESLRADTVLKMHDMSLEYEKLKQEFEALDRMIKQHKDT